MVDVRPALAADAVAIAAINVRAWNWAYRGVLPDAMLAGMDVGSSVQKWTRIIEDGDLELPLVAVIDGRIRGYVHQGASRDEDADSSVGEVTALYIDESCVGTGVGRALWEAALNLLRERGFGSFTVWVLDSNERGRAFYERVGLELDGIEKLEGRGSVSIRGLRYRGSLTN